MCKKHWSWGKLNSVSMGKQAKESELGQKIAQFGNQWDSIRWKSFLPSFFDATVIRGVSKNPWHKKTKCILIVTKLSWFIVGTIPTLTARLQRTNHKPKLCLQHCNHHDKMRKNVIPYGVGLTQSIGYCRNRLANRKTAIIVRMTLHIEKTKK